MKKCGGKKCHACQWIRDTRAGAEPLDAGTLALGASISISVFPDHGKTLDTLLNPADAAMYRAKRAGKGTFAFYSPDDGTLFRE